MANDFFAFKQFTINHKGCAMKVGTDGVLLGAWTKPDDASHILDIGTGTGLLALMLAQKSNAKIDAIDINEQAIMSAKYNIKNSLWAGKIQVIQSSIQSFVQITDEKYDLIISNPPYFINSLKAPDKNRTTARHSDSLSYKELIEEARKILAPSGKISIIYPSELLKQIVEYAESIHLYPSRVCKVHPNIFKPPKRVLIELKSSQQKTEKSAITIEMEKRHDYTKEFVSLTKDYYLSF